MSDQMAALPQAAADHVAARSAPVPLGQKLGYAAGALVDGTSLHPLNIFLLFYVTSVCGLPAGLAGAAIAAGLVVDAVADPLIGSSSDRLKSKWGRRLPFMLAAVPIVALSFTLIFSLPSGLNTTLLFLWLTSLSISLRISVAAFLLPHQALGAELTDNYAERSTIMAMRWAFFMIGGLLGVVLGFGVFFSGPTGLTVRSQYPLFAMTLSVFILVGGLIAARSAYATRGREHEPQSEPVSIRSFLEDIAQVFRSASFRILFFGGALFFIGFGLNTILGLHANTFFWRLTSGQMQLITMAMLGGLLLAAPLAGPILSRLEKRTVLMGGVGSLMVIETAPVLLRLAGLFPFEGDVLAWILTGASLVGGAMLGAAGIATASALADAADEHEFLFGSRREGLYFAGWAFSNKASSAIGTLVAGLALQMMAFPTDLVKEGALSINLPQQTINLLGLAYGPGAGLLSLAAILTFITYRIDRKRHAEIITALREARERKV
ncbi:MFS transporter [Brevundimonas nasdae]|uniref:MFS transporter n=1 Tax=Brevundimonas nasdae TaxID=172043 RepID=UPI003F68CA66